jgi:hypothetical protein
LWLNGGDRILLRGRHPTRTFIRRKGAFNRGNIRCSRQEWGGYRTWLTYGLMLWLLGDR